MPESFGALLAHGEDARDVKGGSAHRERVLPLLMDAAIVVQCMGSSVLCVPTVVQPRLLVTSLTHTIRVAQHHDDLHFASRLFRARGTACPDQCILRGKQAHIWTNLQFALTQAWEGNVLRIGAVRNIGAEATEHRFCPLRRGFPLRTALPSNLEPADASAWKRMQTGKLHDTSQQRILANSRARDKLHHDT